MPVACKTIDTKKTNHPPQSFGRYLLLQQSDGQTLYAGKPFWLLYCTSKGLQNVQAGTYPGKILGRLCFCEVLDKAGKSAFKQDVLKFNF